MRYALLAALPLIGLLTATGTADESTAKNDKAAKPTDKAPSNGLPAGSKKGTDETGSTGESSSLKVGTDLPGSFHPYNATGPAKGKYHCLVSEHGLNPLVLVFVRTLEPREVLKELLHKLDAAIEKNPGAHLAAMLVYVPDELKNVVEEDDLRDQLALKLEDLARSDPPLKHVVLALDTKPDVAKYLADDDAVMTVLLHRKYRVEFAQSLPRSQVTEAKLSQIVAEITTKLGTKKK